ncbi:sodium channel regulatory subunit beta-4 [Discoglossus pictus]
MARDLKDSQDFFHRRSSPFWQRHPWMVTLAMAAILAPVCLPLEVTVGKNSNIKVRNGTDVILPCLFSACFGFESVTFAWTYTPFNSSVKPITLYQGFLKDKTSDPKAIITPDDQVELVHNKVALPKDYNLSLLLKNADFYNSGRYTCAVTNKKEKDAKHNATLTLTVVDKFEVVDNTLTIIIVSAVGGVIGLLILILLIKKIVNVIRKKNSDKKDCLVSSSVNDNTENASKPEMKVKPKA